MQIIEQGVRLVDGWSDQLLGSGVTVGELRVFWLLYPDLTFETALGGVLTLKSGRGQVRTEPLGPPGEPSEDFVTAFGVEESPEKQSEGGETVM